MYKKAISNPSSPSQARLSIPSTRLMQLKPQTTEHGSAVHFSVPVHSILIVVPHLQTGRDSTPFGTTRTASSEEDLGLSGAGCLATVCRIQLTSMPCIHLPVRIVCCRCRRTRRACRPWRRQCFPWRKEFWINVSMPGESCPSGRLTWAHVNIWISRTVKRKETRNLDEALSTALRCIGGRRCLQDKNEWWRVMWEALYKHQRLQVSTYEHLGYLCLCLHRTPSIMQ
jgi:hypothetical protein